MERLLHNLGSEGWLGWGRESPLSPHIRARPRYTITIAARPARHSPRTRLSSVLTSFVQKTWDSPLSLSLRPPSPFLGQ